MGYMTFRLFRDVPLERLAKAVRANLNLWQPGTELHGFSVSACTGDACSALRLGYHHHEEQLLFPIGSQLGAIWMDVRYQDGESWDLSAYEGSEHKVSHSVNPWAFDERPQLTQKHVDFRIGRVIELWPKQGENLRPYLLPWYSFKESKKGSRRGKPRKGKAYPSDQAEYGDACQIWDFVKAFGLDFEDCSEITANAQQPVGVGSG